MRVLKVEQGPLIRSWHIMTTRLAFRKWVGNSTFTCYVRVIHKKRQHKVRFLSPKSENLNYSWLFDFLVGINRMILWWNFIVFAPNEFQLKGFNNTIKKLFYKLAATQKKKIRQILTKHILSKDAQLSLWNPTNST